MGYFIDSNVIIGYYFDNIDNWGPDAMKVFSSKKQKHSGVSVKLECFGSDDNSGRCHTIKKGVLNNFRQAIKLLIETESTTELIATAIDEKWKIVNIIQDLILQYGSNIQLIITEMRNARRSFENDCNNKTDEICETGTVFFHNRNESYSELYKILETEINDEDDIEVILDAHHVGSTVIDIPFISGDYEHIVKNSLFIIKNTAINQIIPLGSFYESA